MVNKFMTGNLIAQLLPAVEEDLQNAIRNNIDPQYPELVQILNYHMGWEGPGAGASAQGKRIRPILLLLCAIAVDSNWKRYLPFATAVELLHNFSLIHDDIEDNSPLRRGRETVWKLWGIPQAINIGDLLFTIAHISMLRNAKFETPAIPIQASKLLHRTCIKLTQGQYKDMQFETKNNVSVGEYWDMVAGKTAALIACCGELGAIETPPPHIRQNFRIFGESLGLAFQVQDDILGIWGNTSATGKSNALDIITRKKTLPVLYALEHNPEFSKTWNSPEISEEMASDLAQMIKHDGTHEYAKNLVETYTTKAIRSLDAVNLNNPAITLLKEFAHQLTDRIN